MMNRENKPAEMAATEPAEDRSESESESEVRELSEAEQMALYEEALKEEDWGHQPC